MVAVLIFMISREKEGERVTGWLSGRVGCGLDLLQKQNNQQAGQVCSEGTTRLLALCVWCVYRALPCRAVCVRSTEQNSQPRDITVYYMYLVVTNTNMSLMFA